LISSLRLRSLLNRNRDFTSYCDAFSHRLRERYRVCFALIRRTRTWLGAATYRIPLLWVYAENDHFFGPRLVAQLTAAFSNAGGNVTFVKTPPFGCDGHQLFDVASGIPVWSPIVDRFLASNNLVLRDKLMDVPLPDVRPPSTLNGRGREAFATYLASEPNKAFAVGGGSHFGWATGRRTTEQAVKDALGFCLPAAKCTIVNVNNKPADKF
jgi:hypothetical protein